MTPARKSLRKAAPEWGPSNGEERDAIAAQTLRGNLMEMKEINLPPERTAQMEKKDQPTAGPMEYRDDTVERERV
jgi:hypothetical protein